MSRRAGLKTFVAIISLGSVGITLAVQAVSPALPELQRVLGLNNAEIGWFTTAYVLPGAIFTVPMGILGDIVGRRLLFCTALAIYGAVGMIEGTTQNYPLLLFLRTVQGACFAAVMPLTITIVGEAFRGAQRIKALSERNAILTGSEVVLPIVGALLAALSWRAPLLVQGITIPLAAVSFFMMEEKRISSAGRQRYARDLIRVLRAQHGMFAILLASFSRFFFKFVMLAYLPVLLVNQRDASLTEVGIVISLTSLVAVVAATQVPASIRRLKPSALVIGSVLALALATGAFTFVPDWRWALAVAAFYGLGDGALSVLLDTYAIHTAHPNVRAGMVSVSQMARNLGKLLSPLAMTAVIAVLSVRDAFLVMAAFGLCIAPLILPVRSIDEELQSLDAQPEIGDSAPASTAHE